MCKSSTYSEGKEKLIKVNNITAIRIECLEHFLQLLQ